MEVQQQNNKRTDWLLLVFMILFTNQLMLSVKIMAIAGIYVLRPNFRFGTGKDRLPKFYLLIMLLSAINFLFFIGDFSSGHFAAFVVGNMFWLFSFMAAHQIKLSIERYGTSSTHRLLKWFMVIHFLFCVGQLIKVMILAGTINPYRQSIPFPYGMSTGDNLYGTFWQRM